MLTRGKDKGKTIVGYQGIKSIRGRTPWYNLGLRETPDIIFPSIFWARYTVFLNTARAYPTNAFFEINARRKNDVKVLCAILNSTYSALMVEFAGRYIENRDKTISNQIMVFEVGRLPVIDVAKVPERIKKLLIKQLYVISKKPMGLRSLYEPDGLKDRYELDKLVFCELLGMSEKQMNEAREGLAEIVKSRIERPLLH